MIISSVLAIIFLIFLATQKEQCALRVYVLLRLYVIFTHFHLVDEHPTIFTSVCVLLVDVLTKNTTSHFIVLSLATATPNVWCLAHITLGIFFYSYCITWFPLQYLLLAVLTETNPGRGLSQEIVIKCVKFINYIDGKMAIPQEMEPPKKKVAVPVATAAVSAQDEKTTSG